MVTRRRPGFSARLKECCDAEGIQPRERASALRKIISESGDKVSYRAAKNWLEDDSVPQRHRLVLLARHFRKRPEYLEYGLLPKSADACFIEDPRWIGLFRQIGASSAGEQTEFLNYALAFFARKASTYLAFIERRRYADPGYTGAERRKKA